MAKHTYTAHEQTWKPELTMLRKIVARHVERIMDQQVRLTEELEWLRGLQGEFRKWDAVLPDVRTAEQLRRLPV